jgi:hypothetical protein
MNTLYRREINISWSEVDYGKSALKKVSLSKISYRATAYFSSLTIHSSIWFNCDTSTEERTYCKTRKQHNYANFNSMNTAVLINPSQNGGEKEMKVLHKNGNSWKKWETIYCTRGDEKHHNFVTKVPRLCPLVLLIRAVGEWRC